MPAAMRSVQLSPLLFGCILFTLVLSLLAHILCLTESLHKPTSSPQAEVNGSSDPVFPFALRPAALTVTKSSRLGLAGSDEDWDIMPPGEGVIYIPEHDMHYLISQYHQLHCLRNFREYILAGAPLNTLMYGHIDHCLGYLRQMVMCAADSSLEPASHRQRAPDGTIKSVITGVDIVHQCRDWSQLDEYARANYARYKETFNLGNKTSSDSSSGVM